MDPRCVASIRPIRLPSCRGCAWIISNVAALMETVLGDEPSMDDGRRQVAGVVVVTLSREPGKGTPQPRCLTGAREEGVQLEMSRSSRTQRSPTPEPAAQDGEKTKVASTIAQPVPPAQQPPAPQVTTTSKSRAPAVVHVDLSPSPEREEFDFEKEIRRRDAAIAQQSAMQGDRAAPVAKRCPCTPCKPGVPVPPPAKQSASKCDQRQLGTQAVRRIRRPPRSRKPTPRSRSPRRQASSWCVVHAAYRSRARSD